MASRELSLAPDASTRLPEGRSQALDGLRTFNKAQRWERNDSLTEGPRAGDVPVSGAFQSKNALTCRRRRHI